MANEKSSTGVLSRLAATQRRQGNEEIQIEDVLAEEEEQERQEVLESVAAQLSPRHPICYDFYCLCDLAREDRLDGVSVVILKEILNILRSPLLHEIGRKIWCQICPNFKKDVTAADKKGFVSHPFLC